MTVRANFFQGIVCQKGGTFPKPEQFQRLPGEGATQKETNFPNKKTKTSEKGKPSERMGRKATGPKAVAAKAARPPIFRYTLNNERRTK